MNFFDFLNSINTTKINLIDEDPENEKIYNSFMINRSLSNFIDTIMYANEMNKYSSLPKHIQYDFFLYGVKKRKRFSKFHKKDASSDDVELIMKAYDYSTARAESTLKMLSQEQLIELREYYSTGGK